MKGCNYIRERIDEADKPDLLSFEVTGHIAQCADCERFAAERSALRKLVASSSRVSAPMNFDAVLNSRLAEVKSRRSFWWLSSPGFLRLGAATAGLAVMVFAAQFAGLFGNGPNRGAITGVPNVPGISTPAPVPPAGPAAGPLSNAANGGGRGDAVATVSVLRNVRSRRGDVRTGPPVYMTGEDGGVVLVRGRNGEMDVQMPTVSVGAQPLLYVRAGQRSVSNIGTSF